MSLHQPTTTAALIRGKKLKPWKETQKKGKLTGVDTIPSELVQLQGQTDAFPGHGPILYALETWTIPADIERRIQAFEMIRFYKLLCISYRDHITNEEVKARIGNAIGPHEDLLTSVNHAN